MPAMVRALMAPLAFDSTAAFTFDPQQSGRRWQVDFIGIAEHEISEVMGAFLVSGKTVRRSGRYSPLDFFRYSSPGTLDLMPENGAYFAINGGTDGNQYFLTALAAAI